MNGSEGVADVKKPGVASDVPPSVNVRCADDVADSTVASYSYADGTVGGV